MSTSVPDTSKTRRPWERFAMGALVIATFVAAMAAAPTVDSTHDPGRLATFFTSVAAISATLLVAAALFQGALGPVIAYRTRRWVGAESFLYLAVSTVGGTLGTVPTWSDDVYRWLFGVTAAAGLGGVATLAAMGIANIHAQRLTGSGEVGRSLDQR